MEDPIDKIPSENSANTPVQPSKMLKILCILTFIGSGFTAFQNLMYTLFLDAFKKFVPVMPLPFSADESNQIKESMLRLLEAGRLYFFIYLLLNLTSVVGAYMMLKLRRQGFHFYTISQIIILMLPMIFMKGLSFSVIEIFITLSFIFMYAAQFKILNSKAD